MIDIFKGLFTSEEPDTCDNNGANMVPAEWSLINLCEGKPTTLIGIFNVCVLSNQSAQLEIMVCYDPFRIWMSREGLLRIVASR